MGGRFLDRLGAGFRSAPRDALIAASASDENRGRAFGLEGIGDNLGAFLGPLLAVLLVLKFHFEIRWIFYLAIVPGLLAFFMILLVRERPAAAGSARSKIDLSSREFADEFWKYLLVIALFGVGNSSNSFLILQTKTVSASFEATILIYAAFNLAAALISYPAGSLSDKWGRRNTLFLSFVIFFISYLGFARTRSVTIAVLFVFYGLFQGIFRSVGKAFASDFVPERLRASGVGWFSTTVGLLQLVASVVAGLLWDRASHSAVFCYGAVCAIAGSVGLFLIPEKRFTSSSHV